MQTRNYKTFEKQQATLQGNTLSSLLCFALLPLLYYVPAPPSSPYTRGAVSTKSNESIWHCIHALAFLAFFANLLVSHYILFSLAASCRKYLPIYLFNIGHHRASSWNKMILLQARGVEIGAQNILNGY